MGVTHIVCYGDSITEGAFPTNFSDGGAGNWVEQWSNRLADFSNDAQRIISPGFRGMWLSAALAFNSDASAASDDEWTVDTVAHWTPATQGASYNKAPHGQLWFGGNGASAVATWHRKNHLAPLVGFDLLYTDGPLSGTTGNWQYSIDGGAWTNMGQSPSGDGNLHKFYVNAAVTSTVSVRQYDGTANSVLYPVGIIPYYADPRTANGMVFHNLGRFGFWLGVTSNILHANTGADPLAFFDACGLGTNAVSHKPVFSTLEFVNDLAVFKDPTRWSTDLDHYWTRYSTINVPLVLFQMYELTGLEANMQASYRTNSGTFASGKNVTLFNLFLAYQNLGFGGVGAQAAKIINVLSGDGTHPNQFGSHDMAQRLIDVTKTTFYPTIYQPSWAYTAPAFRNASTPNGTAPLAGQIIQIYLLSDTVGITATVTRSIPKVRSFSDAVGITDVARAHTARHFAFSNATGITDVLADTPTHTRTFVDTVGTADVVAQAFVQPRDTVGITATISERATRSRVFAETVGLSAVATAKTPRILAAADTVGISATISDHLVVLQILSEAVGVTDFLTEHAPKVRFFTDTVGIVGTGRVTGKASFEAHDTVGIAAVMTIRLITSSTSQKIYTPTIAVVQASQNAALVSSSANVAIVI